MGDLTRTPGPDGTAYSYHGSGSKASGCLKGCLVIVGVVLVVGAIAFQSMIAGLSGPEVKPMPAQASTASQAVTLSSAAPIVTATVTITFPSDQGGIGDLLLGVSLDIPVATVLPSSLQPQALFLEPVVRLSLADKGGWTCIGPCELALDRGSCRSGCVLTYPIRVELVSPRPVEGGEVRVDTSIRASAVEPVDRELPHGLSIKVTLGPSAFGEGRLA